MLRTILIGLFIAFAIGAFAQAPQKFNYQAVARNAQGTVLANQVVTVRASVLNGSASGNNEYTEAHSAVTNAFGLFTLSIGGGSVLNGQFNQINWANGNKFLKIEIDPAGGNNFTLTGVNQLLSVPYAMYADQTNMEAGPGISVNNNVIGNTGDLSPTNELQTLSINGNTLQISNGNQVVLPAAPVYTGGQGVEISGTVINNTGDLSNTNEIQTLTLSGNSVSLSQNGGAIALPTPTAGNGINVNGWQISNTGDLSNTNEIQTLTLSGNSVSLSQNGGAIALPTPTAGNGINVNGWQISNTGDLSNTNEIQTLSLSGSTLSLSQNGGSITLPSGTSSQWTTSGNNIYYNTGNVGIGTSTPNNGKLQFDNSTGDKIVMFHSSNTDRYGIGLNSSNLNAFYPATGRFSWRTDNYNGSEVAVMTGNGRLGIGTASPSAKLDIASADNNATTEIARFMAQNLTQGLVVHWGGIQQGGSSSNANFEINAKGTGHIFLHASPSGAVASTGNVGIGTTSPSYKLHVNGSTRLENEVSVGGGNLFLVDGPGITGGRFKIQTDGKITMGNTSTPGNYRLYVADGILTERLKVALKSTGNWADYVFEPDYHLMPLEQVADYIHKNKHLPGVPSAQEVVREGIDMAEMDAKLLEKIEELTLYMIDLKKENEALKQKINNLEKQANPSNN